jgi:hypothetical protein
MRVRMRPGVRTGDPTIKDELPWDRGVRFAHDSPLERDGFEPLVPQQIRSRFRDSSPVSHVALAVSR